MTTQLGIFAKACSPGRVKTRLAAGVGEENAATIAERFLHTLVDRLAGTTKQKVIGFAPANSGDWFRERFDDTWELQPQCEGDLGDRMRHYFATAFAKGAERVVLLGADSPNLPLEYVEQAFEQLKTQRLVLGPTGDGGYYLIGASGVVPPVFDAMPWSSNQLWQATETELKAIDWREGDQWSRLPSWYDVDTIEDLQRLQADLANTEEQPLQALRQEIQAKCSL